MMEKILYASMGKVTGPYASQFYSVHVFFVGGGVFFFHTILIILPRLQHP